MAPTSHSITLSGGYTDKEKNIHRDVVFGRRLLGRDLMALDNVPQAKLRTQYQCLLVKQAITKFGTLPLPITLETLLSLAVPDLDDLIEAYNQFALDSASGRQPDFVSDSIVHLSFGFDVNAVIYDVVEFGEQLTGFDKVEADKQELSGLSRECFLYGRQIKRLSQSEGSAVLNGPIELKSFESLDAADIANLQIASEIWRGSFRRQKEAVQRERAGAASAGAGEGDKGLEQRSDTEAPRLGA